MSLIFVLSSFSKLPLQEVKGISIDKIHHTIEYGILCYLMLRAFKHSKRLNSHMFFYAFIFSSLFGVSDEFHQKFVEGRSASVFDWFFDISGAFLVAVAAFYIHHFTKDKR